MDLVGWKDLDTLQNLDYEQLFRAGYRTTTIDYRMNVEIRGNVELNIRLYNATTGQTLAETGSRTSGPGGLSLQGAFTLNLNGYIRASDTIKIQINARKTTPFIGDFYIGSRSYTVSAS